VNIALILFVVFILSYLTYVSVVGALIVMIPSLISQPLSEAMMYFMNIDFNINSLPVAAVGIGIGMIAAAAATRVMTALLFGVSALDPLTYVAVAVALGGTALIASYLPAVRATRIDPAVALRTEI
jgi:ABC-type lipoprotein release transport system permease subunit